LQISVAHWTQFITVFSSNKTEWDVFCHMCVIGSEHLGGSPRL